MVLLQQQQQQQHMKGRPVMRMRVWTILIDHLQAVVVWLMHILVLESSSFGGRVWMGDGVMYGGKMTQVDHQKCRKMMGGGKEGGRWRW